MTIPDLDPILPEELSHINADELNSVEALRLIRKSIDHPYYREKSGAAGSFLEILDQKIKSVPGITFSKEIQTEVEAIEAIGHFWQISSLSPEQVKPFISSHALPILESEYSDINKLMTVLLLSYEGLPDYFLRWLDAFANGFRTAAESIGSKRIKIYTGASVDPTIGNWTVDYERFAQNHPAKGNIIVAEYVSKSPNVKILSDDERQLLTKLFHWFNVIRFGEAPVASVVGEEKIQVATQAQGELVQPIKKIYTSQMSGNQEARIPVSGSTIPVPKGLPGQSDKSSEQIVQAGLTNSQNLVKHFETLEKELPLLDKSNLSQLATLIDQALTKGDSGRAVAGLFQVVRQRGIEILFSDPSMLRVMRSAIRPYLESTFQIPEEIATRAVDLPTNRLVALKEFLRLLFTKAAGSENDSARLMVHLASMIPDKKVGPEATFAYFDLGAERFRWAKTDVRPEDGLMSSKIV